MSLRSCSASYDVAVVGAGVVGCAVARRLTLDGARVLVLERQPDVIGGASKGNSGILHTGFDAPPGSLEQQCIAQGRAEYLDIRERLGLPLLETGAMVVAWTDEDEARLDGITAQALANGVATERLEAAAVAAREPGLSRAARGAVLVRDEHVIDPWSAPHAYLLQAIANGAQLRRACALTGAAYDGQTWSLGTTRGRCSAGVVINCAGLYGDAVDQLLTGKRGFEIRPRKGQFVVYDKPAARLLRTIILPVPGETTKGIVICRTAYGNLLVGPTAEEQASREDASTEQATLESLHARGVEMLPALANMRVTASYAGLRPATEEKHYRVRHDAARQLVTLGGIRSTGLSAALGLARHVSHLLAGTVPPGTMPEADRCWPRLPNLAEHLPRDWSAPGNGGIVCHCELVTRREIEAALAAPLPVRTLSGLKRRTRVTMGRCQGFYCAAGLSELTANKLDQPIAVIADEPPRPRTGSAASGGVDAGRRR